LRQIIRASVWLVAVAESKTPVQVKKIISPAPPSSALSKDIYFTLSQTHTGLKGSIKI
jgi:hypothetical protein